MSNYGTIIGKCALWIYSYNIKWNVESADQSQFQWLCFSKCSLASQTTLKEGANILEFYFIALLIDSVLQIVFWKW